MTKTPTSASEIAHSDSGRGPTVVLIHGMGSSSRQWRPTVPALAESHRVLSVDLPGFGDSAELRDRVFAGFADAVASLTTGLGAGPVAVIGHSFGGMVAIDLADRHAGLVRQVILVASAGMHAGGHHAAWAWHFFKAVGPVLGPLLASRHTAPLFLRRFATRLTPDMIDDLVWGFRRARTMWRPASAADFDFPSALRRVAARTPIALIWGEKDAIVPLTDGRRMQSICGAELLTFADVGHLPMYEARDEFNATLERLLSVH